MKPTQFELSTLAAALATPTRSLTEAVEMAGDLWDAVGKSLSVPEPGPQDPTHLSLEVFLRKLQPKDSLADRTKEFRDFLRWQILGGFQPTGRIDAYLDNGFGGTALISVNATEKNILTAVVAQMEYYRQTGVYEVPKAELEFRAWKKHASGQSRSAATKRSRSKGSRRSPKAK